MKPKGFTTYTPGEIQEFIESDRADRSRIRNYVRRAPAQTITAFRREVEKAPGWEAIPIPAECFADRKLEVRD